MAAAAAAAPACRTVPAVAAVPAGVAIPAVSLQRATTVGAGADLAVRRVATPAAPAGGTTAAAGAPAVSWPWKKRPCATSWTVTVATSHSAAPTAAASAPVYHRWRPS